jgi:hypothetical protein
VGRDPILAGHAETFATKHELEMAILDMEVRRYRAMFIGALVVYVCTNVALWAGVVALLR